MGRFVYSCCFCGTGVKDSSKDPCSVTVLNRHKNGQTFWCHLKCFIKALKAAFRHDLCVGLGGKETSHNWRPVSPQELERIRKAIGRKKKI